MSRLLSTTEAAAQIGVTVRTLQRWCRQRTVSHTRIGPGRARIRFTQEQVDEIIEANAVEAVEVVKVDIPNPRYQPHAVVIPMRRPPAA